MGVPGYVEPPGTNAILGFILTNLMGLVVMGLWKLGLCTRRGYTVRPTNLPLEASASSEGAAPEDRVSRSVNFQTLRAPVKFDTDGITSPNWSPPSREETNFVFDEGPNLQIHRVTCNQDFPSSWQPARRIITFMGAVSFACTLLVVAIILVAVALSKTAQHRSPANGLAEIVYLVPQPRHFHNRTPTVVVHRRNPMIWKRHADDLAKLVKAYRDRQGAIATSNCDLHYAPIGVSSCSFPLDRISDNCTAQNNFGYDTGNPCVALVFNTLAGWLPQPYNLSNPREIPPELLKWGEYDPNIVRITCKATVMASKEPLEVQYSPFQGFPVRFLPSRGAGTSLPPLVMVQFFGSKAMTDVDVTCILWAKNLPRNSTSAAGNIRFSLFIV
ncbi:uncharacterized protein LOC129230133 [Uloborus diversus]|uniref:uncharacterized protein LOC129230133 n=1 Tax=Uloborus diversus TaxID=327109 RepID=UPI002409D672|nr:uncharacterized protein LOC129230133 [Uloborus diversus]